tara:strand:+ start:328 stop:1014 length:687 start_codon:yes stop_codon:yes gene_type:complete
MREQTKGSDHLIKNLERITLENSIINYKSKNKALLSLGQGNIHEWLESLLPNTRIILEPKIIGTDIGIQYLNGKVRKAINENNQDITDSLRSVKNIPSSIPIKKRIEIRGVIFDDEKTSNKYKKTNFLRTYKIKSQLKRLRFIAFQIYHCNINHFQSLQELKKLNFEIPQTHFTNFTSDIEIYLRCWKEGKLFKSYPTNGIVLKINSRRLQKYLGENNISRHWAYAIN